MSSQEFTQKSFIQRLMESSSRWLAVVGLIALIIISSLTVIDAIMRRFFASSIDGLSDWVEWSMIIAVSACIPAMIWGGHAIAVRILGRFLPKRGEAALESFGHLMLGAVLAVIAVELTWYTNELYIFGDTSMLLQWKKWPVWAVATAIWWFAVLLQLLVVASHVMKIFAKDTTADLSDSLKKS